MTQSPVHRSSVADRFGLTLVEILIAMVMTLIVMFAMMEAFKYASGEMQRSRAVIEMSGQLRGAQELLRSDLEHVTLDPKPSTQTALPKGYFEYVEARYNDNTFALNATNPTDNYLGDVDDILAFTANRPEQPFRGRIGFLGTDPQESPMAEIIWWTEWTSDQDSTDNDDRNNDQRITFDESATLYRRVLLIRPDLNDTVAFGVDDDNNDYSFKHTNKKYEEENNSSYDLSFRVVSDKNGNNWIVANTLEDLSNRAARFARQNNSSFPHLIDRELLENYRMKARNELTGDDVVLTNIAGFDVRVYSPTTAVRDDNTLTLQPGDVGFSEPPSLGQAPPQGAYVDLNHGGSGWFATTPDNKSKLNGLNHIAYDTWTPVYENDGLDQDNDGIIDQGTNGINDSGTAAVDDTAERETMPPYGNPIRGLKVSFRLVEKNTKQVRQASVIHSFVPE